jgi:hypothetical protein
MKQKNTSILSVFMISFLIIACNRTEKNSPIQSSQTSSNINLSTQEATLDTNIRFELKNDSAFLFKGKSIISAINLSPTKRLGDTIQGNEYVSDEAYFVANSMLVLRQVHYMGDFCHTPSVKSVELYTSFGDTIYPVSSNYLGNVFNAPSGQWAIIADEAEGEMYGYTHITDKGLVSRHDLNSFLSGYPGDFFKSKFLGDSCLFFEQFERDFRNHHSQLSIFKDGSFVLALPPKETDTIQFVFFNEYEPKIYTSQPYQYIEYLEKDSVYFKSSLDMRKHYSYKNWSYVNFNFFINTKHFMFTGIPSSSRPLNIEYANLELADNDSLYLLDKSVLSVDIAYTQANDIRYIDDININYHHQGQAYSIIDSTLLAFTYQGEKAIRIFSKAIGDINGDTYKDFLFIIESDLCHMNIAILSDYEKELSYKTVFVDEFCWD